MAKTVEEHVARSLARAAGAAEDEWRQYEAAACEAIFTMRLATPEILESIKWSLNSKYPAA